MTALTDNQQTLLSQLRANTEDVQATRAIYEAALSERARLLAVGRASLPVPISYRRLAEASGVEPVRVRQILKSARS